MANNKSSRKNIAKRFKKILFEAKTRNIYSEFRICIENSERTLLSGPFSSDK